ncbi:B3 domain-containing transcription factor VRN1-like [Lolium perenne]|uniref:B3 domain-containing transcription factor VRN1-like n=1 Tax=Lolium perenne TaxID=4522 RepID=UPI0021F5AC71|nr:B3 domain-containing protein At1g49475-like [Lolium perenne]
MLGSPVEVPGEGPTKKHRGRPAKVGHFHEDAGPDHFLRIVFKATFGHLMIPKAFVKWFEEISSNIIVTTNTGCNWRMTTRREGNAAFIDQGWTAFVIAHQLKVGQFGTFRKVSSLEYSVVIFDHTYTEVVSRCPLPWR